MKIPVCEPTLQGNELKYVTEAVQSGWISSAGKFITELEEKFAAFCGVKYSVSCSNGTTALHLAVEALGIGAGDEVIIPTFTMAATCNAVIYAGAKPVLIDAEKETWNMDVAQIEKRITSKTKAIMVVHTYGHPVDMDVVMDIARKHHLYVIEDAAEAHGAEYQSRKAGSLGDIAAFSFYANKLMTTGEGGIVVTNNQAWAERAKSLRNHFFGKKHRYLHEELGYNYRLTNIQAALGVAQLEKVGQYIEARRKNAQFYNSLLKEVKGIRLPPEKPWAKNVYWMYGMVIEDDFGVSVARLREELLKRGVDTRAFFTGMHKQPAYMKKDVRFPDISGSYPVADELAEKGLYLPSSSHLTEEQIRYVVQQIRDIQNGK